MTGCEVTCPAIFKKIVESEIPAPKRKSIESYREIRDIIKDKIRVLLEDID